MKFKLADALAFLDSYGVEVHDTSIADEKAVICPFHDDKTPSCQVNIEKQVFRCPVCNAGGDIIDLVAGSMGVKRGTIVAHLEKESDGEGEPINPALLTEWSRILFANKNDIQLLRDRKGISPKTITHFLIGKDGDRFTIPIPDGAGNFINVRKWSPTDKKRKVINLRGHGKRALYPISALDKEQVIIVEGEFKALLLHQLGFNAISPTGGASTWPDSWGEKFRDKVVYVMFDIDKPGKRGAQKVARNLFGKAKEVRIVDLPIDPGEYPTGDITDFVVKLNMGVKEIQECLSKAPEWKPAPLIQEIEDDSTVYPVPLHSSGEAKYFHKFIRTEAVVSAKDTAPFIIPKRALVMCTRDKEICALCPVYNQPEDKAEVLIDDKHPSILSLVNITVDKIPLALKKVAGIPFKCDVCRFKVEETQNVEELRLIPEVVIRNDKEDAKHVVRRAFYVGHGLESNASYAFEARVVAEPNTQYATLLAYRAEPATDNLSLFSMSDEKALQMEVFRPREWTDEGIHEALAVRYEDLEANVTRIYRRRDLHLFYDIIYHSALYVSFQGKKIKGWMEGLVIGDSGQGKSETISNLRRHYQLGEKIDAKGTTVAGLVGGMQETNGRWFVSWGVIPLNDKGLVVLEEVKGMATQVIEKMTDMRSSGTAELSKIEKSKTWARTRQVWVTNPRSDQQLSAYNFGVFAIKELIGALEDVRRFDIFITVASGDVDRNILNIRDRDRPQAPHVHTSDLCRDLILRAWSRTADQIIFEPEAVEEVLRGSDYLGKKYVSNIPLVEAADQRLKVARAAVSLACMTFSGDKDTVVVKRCHASYVVKFFDRLYSCPSMGYEDYSKLVIAESSMADPAEVKEHILRAPNCKDLVRNLLQWTGVTMDHIRDTCEYDRDEAAGFLGLMARKNAMKRGRAGMYFKTPGFITLLREIEKSGELVNESRASQSSRGEM